MTLIETITAGLSKVHYVWPEFNDQFDCIVGLVVNDIPVGVGVFVSTRHVLTSANPFNKVEFAQDIRIYAIKGYYNASKIIKVQKISTYQDSRRERWVPMGINGTTHTSIHDIALLRISKSDKILTIPSNKLLRSTKGKGRRPYPVSLPKDASHFPMEILFVSFGCESKGHKKFLEVSYTSESVADCDEWVPREWGRFVCMLDEHIFYILPSGAPLLEEDMSTVYGLGCFSVRKGNEYLFIFTDLRVYWNSLQAKINSDLKGDE